MTRTQPRRSPRSAPTLDDVAALAGVSPATVSRVMNGIRSVGSESVVAVRRAAAELGYRPNTAARTLARGRSNAVGIVVPESDLDGLRGSFLAGPLRGAARGAERRGMQLVMLLAHRGDDGRLRGFVDASIIDGLMVVLEAHSMDVARELIQVDRPTVFLGRPVGARELGLSYVDSDNYAGARLAVAELADAGRRRIGHIAGPADMGNAVDRVQGWRDELCMRHLVAVPPEFADFTAPGGAAAMRRLLAKAPDLDAVFVASDLMATGALRELGIAGLRVPQDVAVVGYDDSVLAPLTDPPLTSVAQNMDELGERLLDALLELVADPLGAPVRHVVPATLVRRESV